MKQNVKVRTATKTGYIGYVKVENKHYEGAKVKPRLFEMEEHEYEAIR